MDSISIVVLPGDGIGPEVTRGAVRVLEEVARQGGLSLEVEEYLVGGAAIDRYGEPLPQEVLQAALDAGVVLLG
ncbi:MAG TPA: isocitrate/isopropylmalate family dehydrogenase, partial [Acidobacteriota bacterium]|nr:isocitrate/isopropylmalate family dehydrogenase [Acidobacteriota bacterium]